MNWSRFEQSEVLAEPNGKAITFPQDLRSLLDGGSLAYLALDAVQHVKEATPFRNLFESNERRYSSAVLLTLLTYCYASGIYSSQEIERQTSRDETIRYLCANNLPDWNSIRVFRRIYHRAVKECLSYLLRSVANNVTTANGELPNINGRQGYLTFAIEIEAEKRLRKAIQTDSVAMDD